MNLTQQRLKELLHYNPESGQFTWKVRVSKRTHVGDLAGCIHFNKNNKRSYKQISVDKKIYKYHRLVWLYMHGEWPKNHIDHVDQNSLNNKISNLRDVTHSVNLRNSKKNSRNTSGFTGVCWHQTNKKWVATISLNGKMKVLGLFNNKIDAAITRKMAEYEYGYHSNHGL